MNRPGQSSDPNRSNWRRDNRRSASTDDEGRYSRKSIRSSSSTRPGPSTGVATGHGTNPPGWNVPPQQERSVASPSPIHARNTFPRPDGSRTMKSPPTSSTPNRTSTRGPQQEFNRSNPMTPVWNPVPNQPQRGVANLSTPRRNFGPASAPSTMRGPGRKAGSGAPMWDPANEPRSLNISRITAPPRNRLPMEITKSTNYPSPFWTQQDAEYEVRQKVEQRLHKLGEIGHGASAGNSLTQKPRPAYLNPNLQVIQDPGSDDNDDAAMEVDQAPPTRSSKMPVAVGRKLVASNMMAARKTKWRANVQSRSDSDPASSSSDSDTSDSVIELTDRESEDGEGEGEENVGRPPAESEITVTEPPPPLITIPLAQMAPAVPQLPSLPPGPPEELIAALDEICLGPLRMQRTKQLPFLLRNLRRGFHLRCKFVNVKTTKYRPRMPVLVRYEYTGMKYETHMSKWLCPLCELHGALPNKDLLRCHLHWDHPEVILDRWEQRTNNQGKAEWRIHLLVPEILHEIIQPRTYDIIPKLEPQEMSIEPTPEVSVTPPPIHVEVEERRSSVSSTQFSLSPLTSIPPTRRVVPISPSRRDVKAPVAAVVSEGSIPPKFERDESVSVKTVPPELRGDTPRTHRSSTTPSYVDRERSYNTDTMQETEQRLSTIRIEHTPGPPGGIYPSPPPAHDPLGPAAQAPFLPAKSDYDGPDMEYSCRPGGATTFDLLGTLPIEPFGVLEWDLVEREEEIYESDDVKVEHKVMHALWLRWMMLNRNQFIKNYYKGTVAFVDAYWRIIHQAAGWRAMRYWLLLLLTQRFLTGQEVAKALKHYENLTGMTNW